MKALITLLLSLPLTMPNEGKINTHVALRKIGKFSGINYEAVEYEKNYFISQYLKTTPIDARSVCKSYGSSMDLVSFESRGEFIKIRSKLNVEIQTDPVIIGGFLHSSNESDDFYWISSGLKIDYRYDSSKGANKCLGLQNEGAIGFVQISCDKRYLFMCQDVEIQYSN